MEHKEPQHLAHNMESALSLSYLKFHFLFLEHEVLQIP